MPVLLFHGREDSLVAVLAAGIFGVQAKRVDPVTIVERLADQDAADSFLVVHLSSPTSPEPVHRSDEARGLIRIARKTAARLPILVVYDVNDSQDGIATLIDGADAILPHPFHLEAFRAISMRLSGRFGTQRRTPVEPQPVSVGPPSSSGARAFGLETPPADAKEGTPPLRAAASTNAHHDPGANPTPSGSPDPAAESSPSDTSTSAASPAAASTTPASPATASTTAVSPAAGSPLSSKARPVADSLPPGPDGEALAELVKRVAHEVNNPLTTIRGLLQLLLHDTSNNPDLHETMGTYRTIEGEARRISDVVDELEYFSGMRRPARTMVDLGAMLRDVLTELGVDVPNRIKSASLRLLADREQIRFALRHQIGFLIQVAGPDHMGLSVKLTRHGDRATIRLRGHDSTLPDLDKILLPLLCGDEESGQRWSLAGADGIARAHGGRVAVKRRNDGRVEVRFHLPIRDESTLIGQ